MSRIIDWIQFGILFLLFLGFLCGISVALPSLPLLPFLIGVLISSDLFPLKPSCFLAFRSLGNQDAKDQDDAVDEGQLEVDHREGVNWDVLRESRDPVTLGGQDL